MFYIKPYYISYYVKINIGKRTPQPTLLEHVGDEDEDDEIVEHSRQGRKRVKHNYAKLADGNAECSTKPQSDETPSTSTGFYSDIDMLNTIFEINL